MAANEKENESSPLVQAFINALNAKSEEEVKKQAEIMYRIMYREGFRPKNNG